MDRPGLIAVNGLSFEGGTLRQWVEDDARQLVAAWADPEIARWNAVPPEPTIMTASRWIQGQQQRLERRLALDLVIVDDGGDRVVGEVGLSGFSERHDGALIGYWLLPEARGRGLASGAVRAVCAWAHVALELDVIVARCGASNDASQAVAAAAGFVHEANESSGNQLWRSRTRGE